MRALQRAAERDFWEEVVEGTWGLTYKPRNMSRAYWSALESGSFENRYFEWCTQARKPAWMLRLVNRLRSPGMSSLVGVVCPNQGKLGSRSRLYSRPFYTMEPVCSREKTVWVRVEEEETVVADPAAILKDLVQKKIAIVKAVENHLPDLTPLWWSRMDEASALYVQ